ncbi:MAG: Spy/CpxP family protein refolding chaperone [Acidobacteriia bacterium]|nr:Spy/CpxP family protein refolding chaperone [Terriglobia bacterium]
MMTTMLDNRMMRVAAVAAIAVGMAMAQGPGFGHWCANPQAGAQRSANWWLERISTILSLDVSQKAQANTIFDTALAATQALQPALLQAHTDLRNAARTGKDIDKLTTTAGTLVAKMQAIHTTAFAQLYNILTPTQRDQFDKYEGAGLCMGLGWGPGMGMMGGGRGMGMMGRGFGAGVRP